MEQGEWISNSGSQIDTSLLCRSAPAAVRRLIKEKWLAVRSDLHLNTDRAAIVPSTDIAPPFSTPFKRFFPKQLLNFDSQAGIRQFRNSNYLMPYFLSFGKIRKTITILLSNGKYNTRN